jgi:2-pyrone-4,6-dicarboxylate lactonase
VPSYHPSPSKPRLKLPPGACDTHFHVFGPRARFPFPETRTYTPADAPKEKLFALHKHLGIERGVVVQAGAHGFENSPSADLIAAGGGKYVGVALARSDIQDQELEKLNAEGFRGVRFNYMGHLGKPEPIENVMALAGRIAALGWHLQIHMEPALIGELGRSLLKSPVPVVIDHMGRIDASKGMQQESFQNLLRLLDDKNVWVKVSGSERASKQPAPWRDAVPFATKLVAEFGDRTLWGTDWPHPNLAEIPDDGLMVDLLAEIAPSEAQRHALLVDNPGRFYFGGG